MSLEPKLKRMCSCCRKEIASGSDSLTLNGMFAHIECVEAVMREPGAMAVVTDLRLVTDDQLRAECDRRWPNGVAKMLADMERDRDDWKTKAENYLDGMERNLQSCRRLQGERDEWKAKAEAAEAHNERRGDWLKEITETCEAAGMPKGITADKAIEWLTASLRELNEIANGAVRRMVESGPGIGSHPPDIHKPDADNAHFVDPLDLLCEDA